METTKKTAKMGFESKMNAARVFQEQSGYPDSEYWSGYQRGLRRSHHGESFGTDAEHTLWMSLVNEHGGDDSRKYRGLGYRAGFDGISIVEAIKDLQTALAPSLLGKKPKTTSEKSVTASRENGKRGGRPMTQARVNELFDLLIKACQQQFGFVPGRISTNMQFMGSVSGGQYRFRDTLTHATIFLKTNPLKARLMEPEVGYTYWTELQMAEYRQTDEEVKTERLEAKNKQSSALQSPFWLSNRDRVYAAFDESRQEEKTPISLVTEIIEAAKRTNSADYTSFAQDQKTDDTDRLANALCDCCLEEKNEAFWQAVKSSPLLQQVLIAKKAFADAIKADSEDEDDFRAQYEKQAFGLFKSLPTAITSGQQHVLFAKHLFMDPSLVCAD